MKRFTLPTQLWAVVVHTGYLPQDAARALFLRLSQEDRVLAIPFTGEKHE